MTGSQVLCRIGRNRKTAMPDNHIFSHLLTFLILGGVLITFGCLILHGGAGLYA
ncbi:hypothetical protein [uncultured Algimonas sp.]|uniref:hypothetical protein n=1 Tax=uncultured Algimonas sp. TaxID=1547920 RepID=UPI00260A14A8|nr:hypothetical protein [uncultured Algimonas sp.]